MSAAARAKNYLWVVVLSCAGYSTVLPAQVLSSNDLGHPTLDQKDFIDTETPEPESDDLRPTPLEVRAAKSRGVALHGGESVPWQQLTLSLSHVLSGRMEGALFVGGGEFRSTDRPQQHQIIRLKTASRGFGVLASYYLSEVVPIAIEGNLSYVTWTGSTRPEGSGEQLSSDSADLLPASFKAQGLCFGIGTKFTYQWASGLRLFWVPIGWRLSTLTQFSLSRDHELSSERGKKFLRGPQLYGFLNVGVGYFF